MKAFAGKTAIVTGSGAGIGRATAEALAVGGAAVLVTDPSWDRAAAVAAAINAGGGRARAAAADVGIPETGEVLVQMALRDLGGFDILVTAGATSRPLYFAASPLEEWMAVLRQDLLGAVHCARAAARILIRTSRRGRIVHVSSVHAFLAGSRCSAHDVSMGGLAGLTRSLALELAPHGILVNAVAPGSIDGAGERSGTTDPFRHPEGNRRIPLGRPARPEEVVKAILFLAGPENTYVTGVNLAVDGGMSIVG